MTEQEWLTSTDPQRMLEWLTGRRGEQMVEAAYPDGYKKPSDRKLRLFACACFSICSCNMDDPQYRAMVSGWTATDWVTKKDVPGCACTKLTRTDILRHILGNPWRPGLTRKCLMCKGRGQLGWQCPGPREKVDPDSQLRVCTTCWGRKQLPVELPGETCRRCKGKKVERVLAESVYGYSPEYEELECCVCAGRGRIVRWPGPIPQLAQALYDGSTDALPGLHDALAECCPEAAAELAKKTRCFKGYWLVDLLLGKE